MKTGVKALTLIGLGLFLYSRWSSGTLLFYINQRSTWLVALAALGLLIIGASYRYHPARRHDEHAFSWGGVVLIGLIIAMGLLVPPKPLGALAMNNRQVNVGVSSSALPVASVRAVQSGEKNILDWLVTFNSAPDPGAFANQAARVVGFVYRGDERFDAQTFMVSRFVVSCCVADATAVGLIVRWPEAASLTDDQWVEVAGHFEPGEFAGEQTPILAAESVAPIAPPNQPYLYP